MISAFHFGLFCASRSFLVPKQILISLSRCCSWSLFFFIFCIFSKEIVFSSIKNLFILRQSFHGSQWLISTDFFTSNSIWSFKEDILSEGRDASVFLIREVHYIGRSHQRWYCWLFVWKYRRYLTAVYWKLTCGGTQKVWGNDTTQSGRISRILLSMNQNNGSYGHLFLNPVMFPLSDYV